MKCKFIYVLLIALISFMGLCQNPSNREIQSNVISPKQYLTSDQKLTAFDQFGIGGDQSYFGISIDMQMSLAVVGAPEAMGHGLAFVYQFDGDNWQLSETLIPDDGQQGDEFGYSVSINQGRIVVGARESSSGGNRFGAAYIFDYDDVNDEWTQVQILLASDGDRVDEFGAAISQHEDTIVIGAPNYRLNGYRGQVYVFTLVGSEWIEQSKIPGLGSFGNKVAINETQMVVSAYGESLEGVNRAGSVYTFEPNGSDWVFEQKLNASDPEENNYFGSSIDLENGMLAIGADKDGNSTNADGAGAVYLFIKEEGVWEQLQKLVAPNEQHFNKFGSHVQIDSNKIFISSVSDETLSQFDGHVHIFEHSGLKWNQINDLGPISGSDDNELGFSLATDNNELLIGAWGDDIVDDEAGSFSSFSFDNNQWVVNDKVDMLPGSARNFFGTSTKIDGNHMMIGSHRDDEVGRESGSVYSYKYTNGEWAQGAKIYADNPSPYQIFGYSIDIDNLTAIIGAPSFGGAITEDPGSAYIYSYNGIEWIYEAELTANDGLDEDFFGATVSINGDYALIGASGSDTFGNRSGAAYIYKKENGIWGLLKKLSIPNPQEEDFFGVDVFINDQWAIVGQTDAVHFFDSNSNWMHYQTINGNGRFGWSIDFDRDTLLVGSYSGGANNRGIASTYTYDGLLWQFDQWIYPKESGFSLFGVDVTISDNNMLIGSSYAFVSGTSFAGAAYWFAKENNTWIEKQTIIDSGARLWDVLGGSVSIDGDQAIIGAVGLDDFGTNSGAAFLFKATDIIFEDGFD